MSTHRHINAICLVVLVFTLALTVLFMNGKALGLQTVTEAEAIENADSPWFTANDRYGDWSTNGATRISLEGGKASVKGGGAYAYDRDVHIVSAGRYLISGSLDDGSIVVDTDSEAKVWILLCGADIRCSDSACIRVEQAEKVFLTLAEGSGNRLETLGFGEEALSAGVDGALFSRDDLALNGKGSLEVRCAGANGIVSNDDLLIAGGRITVSAGGDGLHANDALRIGDASLTIDAGDDGISLTGEESGLILVSGSVNLRSGDKGLAAGDSVLLLGGDLTIDAGSDGINAAGTLRLEGGSLRVAARDDGIHADTAVEIAGGTLNIPDCREGIEAKTIDISGGELDIRPLDDGLNANGSPETEETWIHVSGGSLSVVNQTARNADGLDSNGDILVSGGSIRVSMLNSGANRALDCGSEDGGVMRIGGGDVVACGSFSPAESFDPDSTQCAILYNIRRGIPGGTELRLEDGKGSVLLEYEVPCSFSSVVLSCPELKVGKTYRLVIGDLADEITLTETSSAFGDVESEGFAGPMTRTNLGYAG